MKTIHPIPPAGSEEALIQALETLLAQENPDEARLQALLDQLDRQTGAAPWTPRRAGPTSNTGAAPAQSGGACGASPWPWPPCWCAWRCLGPRWR